MKLQAVITLRLTLRFCRAFFVSVFDISPFSTLSFIFSRYACRLLIWSNTSLFCSPAFFCFDAISAELSPVSTFSSFFYVRTQTRSQNMKLNPPPQKTTPFRFMSLPSEILIVGVGKRCLIHWFIASVKKISSLYLVSTNLSNEGLIFWMQFSFFKTIVLEWN